ncbi:unnamed protein product [Amoebophrya sp. A25]|nr:unnamed protein product [Amoebophrya sp. A25]|eukprot:GSA25T00025511001.1
MARTVVVVLQLIALWMGEMECDFCSRNDVLLHWRTIPVGADFTSTALEEALSVLTRAHVDDEESQGGGLRESLAENSEKVPGKDVRGTGANEKY